MGRDGDSDRALAVLMRAAQAGDSDAYRRFLEAATPTVRATIRGRRAFLPAADVEDLVQDVLLSLHAVRHTYDPGRPFGPWLGAIIRNRLADAARRHARRRAHEVAAGEESETFPALPTNEERVAAVGDPEALRAAIAALPPSQRTAVELLKLREMTLKEAAAASGQSIGALKVAVHRAIRALRQALSAPG